jgi:ribosomal protein L40E
MSDDMCFRCGTDLNFGSSQCRNCGAPMLKLSASELPNIKVNSADSSEYYYSPQTNQYYAQERNNGEQLQYVAVAGSSQSAPPPPQQQQQQQYYAPPPPPPQQQQYYAAAQNSQSVPQQQYVQAKSVEQYVAMRCWSCQCTFSYIPRVIGEAVSCSGCGQLNATAPPQQRAPPPSQVRRAKPAAARTGELRRTTVISNDGQVFNTRSTKAGSCPGTLCQGTGQATHAILCIRSHVIWCCQVCVRRPKRAIGKRCPVANHNAKTSWAVGRTTVHRNVTTQS